MRVIVIGGGIMGLASAWALCRRGHEVALYEQGPLPNPLASSCDQHRLIRFTYGAMTGYARMVADAYAAWERLWADLGQSHYVASGTLVVARDADDWVEQSIACLRQLDLPVERWTAADVARRLPFLDLGRPRCALYTPTGGVLFAERILQDLADLLTRRGVALHRQTPVAELDPVRAAIRTADGRADRADALIVAAGPWTAALLPAFATRVTPSRQVALYLDPPGELQAAWAAAPMLLDQIEAAEGGFYAVPPVGGTGAQGRRPRLFAERRSGPGARADRGRAGDRFGARRLAPAGFRPLSGARGQNLLLQRHRGRSLHRRALRAGVGAGRLLRPRLQVRRAARRAAGGGARG